MGTAIENRGIFFDTGREVWNSLGQEGIDRWRVNEAFLRQQLEAGVEAIQFVGEDVYDILGTWAGIAVEDIPNFRSREVVWLSENAAGYGYTLVGNSWMRLSR